ncbi:type IV pilus twitching motility protein PilT [Rheinheimera sp.]|jgi:twitching motility protein PilT|uniref:type IV pilus twitching motility protein PilT n=1 Tax=Rheinheimera sp. TaxID=1869214 RepID=UPI0040483A4B
MDLWYTLLELTSTTRLSDIHIRAGEQISYREFGDVVKIDQTLDQDILVSFLQSNLEPEDFARFLDHKDLDFAVEHAGVRLRVNAFWADNQIGMVMRKIETTIPNFDDLDLPAYTRTIPTIPSGLVLVTGPTGSGKSTTLAAIIDVINQTEPGHIITIEDPVEFKHPPKRCVVSQREVGKDTLSFANALKASLREDPDVILVGELRDLETIQLALTAAETGHLVFGTLHTNSAPSTINRIIDVFPPSQQEQVRSQLSSTLKAVITQRLFKRADGAGRVGAFEIMICNQAIRNLIRENKIFQIANVMQTARAEGMLLMENSIKALVMDGKISQSAALN